MSHGPFFRLKIPHPAAPPPGEPVVSAWQSPSNIALVKYWGKKEGQLPMNPSLSMTLDKAVTRTRLETVPGTAGTGLFSVNGNPGHPFIPKMKMFLERLSEDIPCLGTLAFRAETANTFPHAAGIASSASGMSAFAMCLLDIAAKMLDIQMTGAEWQVMASRASRLGSGSACRSVSGGFMVWGKTGLVPGSGDDCAVSLTGRIHPRFMSIRDAILIVSGKEKQVPSTAGHRSMDDHPWREGRRLQANQNLAAALQSLETGDFEQLAEVAENEALSLHALLVSSRPAIILLQPATLEIVNRVREARKGGLPVFFTIDAGANVHLLYPGEDAPAAENFISSDLTAFCEQGRVILDGCGTGPERLPGTFNITGA